jgi:four helix bundle protein
MSTTTYIPLEDLEIYKLAMEIGELVWGMVDKWDYFGKKTVGRQFVEAADSIAANISEGYGRFHFKEKRTFYYYARGSLSESKTWATKAKDRNLIDSGTFVFVYEKLKALHKTLNVHINSLPIK